MAFTDLIRRSEKPGGSICHFSQTQAVESGRDTLHLLTTARKADACTAPAPMAETETALTYRPKTRPTLMPLPSSTRHMRTCTHTCGARPDILISQALSHSGTPWTLSTAAGRTLFTRTRVHTHTHSHAHTVLLDLKNSCSHPPAIHMPLSGLTHTHAQTHRLETHQNHCGQRSLKNDRLSVVPRGRSPRRPRLGHTTGASESLGERPSRP